MKNITHIYSDMEKLNTFLDSLEVCERAMKSKSVLVQIFSAKNNQELLKDIVATIEIAIPKANIIGTTTVGEIYEGHLQLGQIILSFSFFDFARIQILASNCTEGSETESGQNLINEILKTGNDISGVLIFATPLTVDISKVFNAMSANEISFPAFGGGAGIYDASRSSAIFRSGEFLKSGIIAAVFLGRELKIYTRSNLGWWPLSKEMTVTEAQGKIVRKIDDMQGFELYKRYLNIKNDDNFFLNVLEFPFLVDRDGYMVARVPFFAHEDNSIEFVADILEGEKFRIGYGDPDSIIQSGKEIQKAMSDFQPESIFIYACICRRFLMQNDVNLETKPFDYIAPTTGFFTYGEFFSYEKRMKLLNSTIVVVGMREGEINTESNFEDNGADLDHSGMVADLYSGNHNRIISSLLHFIGKLTAELEKANCELTLISEVDSLTQIGNRMKMDTILKNEIHKNVLIQEEFSIVILDVDYFKNINDQYGHPTGDLVLIELAGILKASIRKNDLVGRWGGEEFLLILPMTDLESAILLAERIRSSIEAHVFKEITHLTCSFGVSTYFAGESQETLIQRADSALYKAKNEGRNKVSYET